MERKYQAKSLEEALEKAEADLNLEKGEFSYEVVELGSKGFLGLGAKDTVINVTYTPDPCVSVRGYLEGLFELMKINGTAMDITMEDGTVSIQVTGEEAGILMKNRGESVEALQLLLSMIVNRDCGEYYKISFNVNDFKEKTRARLESLAWKTAGQVVRNRRKVTLPPMTSFQRRIIHSKLQDYKDVTTYSVGEEPSRRVVISYCGEDGPAPRAPRTNDRSRSGNRNNYGNRNGKNFSGSPRGGKPGYGSRPYDKDRKPRRDYGSEGEVYTGEITHLPGEKLSGAAAKNAVKPAESAGSSASPVSGGTPFNMGSEN